MKVNYSSILTKAWQITWKFKVLWIFGFLAMLGGSGGWGGYNSGGGWSSPNFRTSANVNTPYEYDYPTEYRTGTGVPSEWEPGVPPEWQSAFDQLAHVTLSTWITIAIVVCCVLALLTLVFWLLSIIGRGGLIGGILAADAEGKVTFREAWNVGLKNFWKLLLVRVLAFLCSFVVSFILLVPAFLIGVCTCGFGLIPWACVMAVFWIAVNIWLALIDYAIVVEKLGIGEAIGRAWVIFQKNIGPLAILYIILFLVSIAVGLAMLVVFAPSAVTIVISLLPFLLGEGAVNVTLLVIGIVLFVLYMLVSIVVNAAFTVWQTAVVTLAYKDLSAATPQVAVSQSIQPAAGV